MLSKEMLTLHNLESVDFNIFQFSDAIGRKKSLSLLGMSLLRKLPGNPTLMLNYDEAKLVLFLN